MKFYRLEHKDTKAGVFRSGIPGVWPIASEFTSGTNHPSPWDDSLLNEEMVRRKWYWHNPGDLPEYIFGFINIQQFRAWFYVSESLEKLEKLGIVLNCYETDDYIVGYTQMIARKETLRFIETLPILGDTVEDLSET